MKRVVVTGYKQHELGIFDDKHPGIGFIKKALESQFIALLDEGLENRIICQWSTRGRNMGHRSCYRFKGNVSGVKICNHYTFY